MFTSADHRYMARALELARRGLNTSDPNPRVGCVLVAGERIVGEGWHWKAGEPHAEVNALAVAGDAARGATVYVTLEPCSHHGRTPPCTEALIAAGVSRVEWLRRLVDAEAVLGMLRHCDVDLVIHGHNHHFSTLEVPHLRGTGTMRICEAGSTSTTTYTDPRFGGKYNVYHIEDGRLLRIDTHLYEAHENAFVHWHEQTFEQHVEDV